MSGNETLIFHVVIPKIQANEYFSWDPSLMLLTFPDYTKLVYASFKKKQEDSEHPLLSAFTRSAIRQQCLNVYRERIKRGERQELSTLQNFFGVPDKGEDFSSLIEWYPLDKFRPLENLMQGRIQSPAPANVELLAWLIDFKHRPFKVGMNVQLADEEIASLEKKPEQVEGRTKMGGGVQEHGETRKKRKGIMLVASLFLAITVGGAFMIRQDKKAKEAFLEKSGIGCMYWLDDHYVKVPCDEEQAGRLFLPLNTKRMMDFKRITNTDTITEWSIGKLYYIKRNKVIELYTTAGNHPVETTRTLRKLSSYMYNKYFSKTQTADKKPESGNGLQFVKKP